MADQSIAGPPRQSRTTISSLLHSIDGTRGLLVLLALAFVLRLIVLLSVGVGVSDPDLLSFGGGDGLGYYELAQSILDGKGFSHPLFILRPPGLPLVEAGLFGVTGSDSPWLVLGFSAVASSLTVVATVVLAESIGVRSPYSLVAGLIIAVEPASVFYGVSPLTEPLFTLVLTTLLLLVVKTAQMKGATGRQVIGWTVAVGLLISAAILIKPLALGLGLVIAAAFVAKYRRQAPRYSLVLVLPLAVGLGWAANNQAQFDNFLFSNSFSFNTLFLKAPQVIHAANGKSEDQVRLELIDELAERRNIEFEEGTVHYDFLTESDSVTLSAMNSLAIEAWIDHPTGNIRAAVTGAYSVLFNYRGLTPVSLLLAPLRIALYLAALYGVVVLWKARLRMPAAVLSAVVGYVVLVNVFALGVGDLRLAVPVYPVFAVLFSVALQTYVSRHRASHHKSSDESLTPS